MTDTIFSFLSGIRFDLSIIFTFYGIPTLLLLLPWAKIRFNRPPIGLFVVLLILVLNIFIFTLIGDLFYFNQVKRHVFDELVTLTGEWDFISDSLFGSYSLWLLCYLIVGAFAGRFIYKSMVSKFRLRKDWSSFLLFLISAVLIVRGGVGLKPLSIVDAFQYGGSQGGQLALNGVFSAWHATRNSSNVTYPPLNAEHFSELSKLLQLNSSKPFQSEFKPRFEAAKKPNVVIFLLESWASKYLKSYGANDVDVTPNFDALVEDGVKFSNFYATGSRSIEAIQSILTSFPSLKGLPTLGHGFELMKTAELGTLAGEAGYDSYFFQAAKRESFHLDSVAGAYGFSGYFGSEDYPKILYPDKDDPPFGWDYEMFMHAVNVFNVNDRPFVSFLFTGTTHSPFVKSEQHLYAEEHGPENEFGFLNTLNYSDWALGEFMKRARSQKWFEDTIFIFTADHTLQTFKKFDFQEGFQVPLLIYAPKYFKSQVNFDYSGHLDILPTVLDIIGTKGPVSLAGRSLLMNYDYRYAFLSQRYSNPAWVDSFGYVSTDLAKEIDSQLALSCDPGCKNNRVQYLNALNAYLYKSVKENSWTH